MTGVQTCALPIWQLHARELRGGAEHAAAVFLRFGGQVQLQQVGQAVEGGVANLLHAVRNGQGADALQAHEGACTDLAEVLTQHERFRRGAAVERCGFDQLHAVRQDDFRDLRAAAEGAGTNLTDRGAV